MNGAANALLWKSSKTQNFTYLTILKHQNTKTSLYKLSENHWVFALIEFFGSVRKKLQSTVFNDHPVLAFVHQNGIQLIVPDQLILPITQAKQSMFNFIWKKEVGIKEYRMTVCSMNYSIVTTIIKG